MNPWVRLLGLLAAVVAAAFLLKVLHPLLVFALLIGGIAYANHVLTVKPKRERTKTTAELLGLRADAEVQGVSAFPFALLQRPQATTSEVMGGPWRGAEVRLFDLETVPSVDVDGIRTPRRFTCVIAPLPIATPHLVVEPESFLTPGPDHADLPAATAGHGRIDAVYDIRCEDPAFAGSFLVGQVAAWLLDQDEGVAFETRERAVLVYRTWTPARDRDLLLDILRGFLDAVPARGSTVDP